MKQRELAFAAEGDPDGGRSSCTDFLRQMGYREYSRYLSFHFPFTHERSLLEHLRACPWRFDQRLFKVRLPWVWDVHVRFSAVQLCRLCLLVVRYQGQKLSRLFAGFHSRCLSPP